VRRGRTGLFIMTGSLRRSIKPYAKALKRALGRQGEELTFVSFPKSGRTWLQVMLGEYITRYYGLDVKNVITLKQYTKHLEGIPRIRFSHDFRPQWKTPGELHTDKSMYRNQKVVLLARDPRDILVSSFFEKTRRKPAKRREKPRFNGSIDEFVYQDIGGIDTIISFYNNWLANRNVPEELRIFRYEDLRSNTRETLTDILRFVGLPEVDEAILDEVLELGRIEKMRNMEAQSARGAHDKPRSDPTAESAFMTRAFQPSDPDDPETFKVRKGKVGGYVDYLGDAEIAFLSKKIREELNSEFGYG
jgi:hypothetical protein